MLHPAIDSDRRRNRLATTVSLCALVLALAAAPGAPSSAQQTPAVPVEDQPGGDPGGSDPTAEPDAEKLDPFPVVIVAGQQGKRATRVSELTVKGPRGARVVVRCLGVACPMRRAATTIRRSGRVRLRKAQRIYRAGLRIEVRVTRAERVGKYTRIRFRRKLAPARSDACLQPGEREPSPCPEG